MKYKFLCPFEMKIHLHGRTAAFDAVDHEMNLNEGGLSFEKLQNENRYPETLVKDTLLGRQNLRCIVTGFS
jgi:hypothetical protein